MIREPGDLPLPTLQTFAEKVGNTQGDKGFFGVIRRKSLFWFVAIGG